MPNNRGVPAHENYTKPCTRASAQDRGTVNVATAHELLLGKKVCPIHSAKKNRLFTNYNVKFLYKTMWTHKHPCFRHLQLFLLERRLPCFSTCTLSERIQNFTRNWQAKPLRAPGAELHLTRFPRVLSAPTPTRGQPHSKPLFSLWGAQACDWNQI